MLNQLRANAMQQNLGAKLMCLSCLSGYWFLSTYGNSPGDFSPADLRNVVSLLILVLLIQVLLTFMVAGLLKSGCNVLLGLFSAVNLFALYLNFVAFFIQFEVYWKLLVLAVAWWMASMCYLAMDGKRMRMGMQVVTALLLLVSAAQAYFSYLPPTVVPSRSNDEFTSSSNVKLVNFTNKPNVYFISFDGMMPESLGRELLGIESLSYVQVLQDQGFTRLLNHFSDGPETKSSLNKLMALDPEYYFQNEQSNHGLVTGHTPAPLLEIFRANGYTTNFFVVDGYLGSVKGPYISKYEVMGDLTLCSFLDNEAGFDFFGYCSQTLDKVKRRISAERPLDHAKVFLGEVAKLLRSKKPFFALTYIYLPGHAEVFYDEEASQLAGFQEDYAANSVSAGEASEHIVKFIRKNDPEALLFFFGDHGPMLTADWHADAQKEGRSLRRHIHDRLGVYASYSLPMDCPALAQARNFSISAQIARRMVQCLAGDEDPFVNEPYYRLRQQDYAGDGQDHEYVEFLYE